MTQRYVVRSRQPVYGVRTGGIVYLTAEEGARKTRSGHVEPAPVPKLAPKPKRTRRTVKPPDPAQAPKPRPDAGLSHVPDTADMAEDNKE